jgi:hypothetical protein
MRLEDLVCAALLVDIRKDGPGTTLLLTDRHNIDLDLHGTDAGIRRALAEVRARVPWALERLDAEAERAWGENCPGTLAEGYRRREHFRGDQPGAPTTPA